MHQRARSRVGRSGAQSAFVALGLLSSLTATLINHASGQCNVDCNRPEFTVSAVTAGSCNGCESLDLPSQLTTLPTDFCSGCSSLTRLDLPSQLTTLPAGFCSGCSSLTDLGGGNLGEGNMLPSQLTTLSADFCSGCSSLRRLQLPSQLTTLPADFCSGCSSLTQLQLPSQLTTLPADFCSGCSSLASLYIDHPMVTLPDDLVARGVVCDRSHTSTGCFSGAGTTCCASGTCDGCASLHLDTASITTLPADFCSGCSVLTFLRLPPQVTINTCSCDMLSNSSIPWTTIRGAASVSMDGDCSGCPLEPGSTCLPDTYTDLLLGECVPCPSSVGQYFAGCILVLVSGVLLAQLYRKTGRESALMAGSAPDAAKKKHDKFQNAIETVDSGIHRAKRRQVGRSLLQINASHLQITTWAWTCDWQWPPFVRMLSQAIGSFIQIDINATAKPECSAIPREFVSVISACSLMMVILLIFFCLQSKYNCAGECTSARPAQQRAHIVSFSVALYTLTFPLLVSQAVAWLDWESSGDDTWRNTEVPNVSRAKTSEMIIATGLAAAWLVVLTAVVPRKLFVALRRHHKDGELHSCDGRSRFGWVYEKFVDKYYWHELALLELRFLTILCGKLLSAHAVASQCLLVIILIAGLALQLRNKPYAESVAESRHWSSINMQAAVADGCKVATVALGLLSTVTNGAEGGTVAHLISAGAVLTTATPLLLAGVTKCRQNQIAEATPATRVVVEDPSEQGESEPQGLVEQIEERIEKLAAELEKHKRELSDAKEAAKAKARSNGGHWDELTTLPSRTMSGDAEMGTHAELVAQARSERTQKMVLLDTEPDAPQLLDTAECFADLPTWLANDLWRDERVQCAL
eukprot:COSAG02_NODE_7107_length_3182_cov_2.046708_1_plen_863_part_10